MMLISSVVFIFLVINIEVFLLRLKEPGMIESLQTLQKLSDLVRHDTLGIPSDVPVPMKIRFEVFIFKVRISENYIWIT